MLEGGSFTLPGGIFTVDLGGGAQRPREARLILDPNAAWRQRVGLVEPEPFTVAVDGDTVTGWFFRPPDLAPGERVPTVLSIHGGPEWMYGGYFLPEFHILPRPRLRGDRAQSRGQHRLRPRLPGGHPRRLGRTAPPARCWPASTWRWRGAGPIPGGWR